MVSLELLRLFFFVGIYTFMGGLACFEVVPRIKNDNVVYTKRLTKWGIVLMCIAVPCLSLFCYFSSIA